MSLEAGAGRWSWDIRGMKASGFAQVATGVPRRGFGCRMDVLPAMVGQAGIRLGSPGSQVASVARVFVLFVLR